MEQTFVEQKTTSFIGLDGNFSVSHIAEMAQKYQEKPINNHGLKIIENIDSVFSDTAIAKIDQVLPIVSKFPDVEYVIQGSEVRRIFGICQKRSGFDIQMLNWDGGGMETLKSKIPNNKILGLFDKNYFDEMFFAKVDCVATKVLEVSKQFATHGGVVLDGGNTLIIDALPKISQRIASGLCIEPTGVRKVLNSLKNNQEISVVLKMPVNSTPKEAYDFMAKIRKTILQEQCV